MHSIKNTPNPSPLWFKKTVEMVGIDCVQKWYKDIADLEWQVFVSAHGDFARNCDHNAMLQAVEQRIENLQTAR